MAALSESRSSARRHIRAAHAFTHAGSHGSPITVDTSNSTFEYNFVSPTAYPVASFKTSKVDFFDEQSSDSEDAISVSSGSCDELNILLLSTEYANLPDTQKPRDQRIPGYR